MELSEERRRQAWELFEAAVDLAETVNPGAGRPVSMPEALARLRTLTERLDAFGAGLGAFPEPIRAKAITLARIAKAVRACVTIPAVIVELRRSELEATAWDGLRWLRASLPENRDLFPWAGEPPAPSETPPVKSKRGMSRDEANVAAREYLQKHARNRKVTVRELAEAIGCSQGLVSRLPAWRAYRKGLTQDKPPAPRAESLTDRVLDNVGQVDAELNRLIAEQEADMAEDERSRSRGRRPTL